MFSRETDRKIKRRIIKTFLWFVILIVDIVLAYDYFANNINYKPTQSVVFSHKSHSGKHRMKCLSCHYSAGKTAFSSYPTTKDCMICHVALKNEVETMKPVNFSYDNNLPIKWNRIYRLPDYVHFNHSRHIRVQIDCASCHGEVETMDEVYLTRALTMKWCLDCHRNPEKFIIPARDISGIFKNPFKKFRVEKSFPLTNKKFGAYKSMIEKPIFQNIPMPKNPVKGPESCSYCHY